MYIIFCLLWGNGERKEKRKGKGNNEFYLIQRLLYVLLTLKQKYLKTWQNETCNLIKAGGVSPLFSTKVRNCSDDLWFIRRDFSKNLFSDVKRELPVFWFLPLASGLPTGHQSLTLFDLHPPFRYSYGLIRSLLGLLFRFHNPSFLSLSLWLYSRPLVILVALFRILCSM